MSNEARQFKAQIRPATYEDCLSLAPLLRKEDKDEVWASDKLLPEEALIQCLRMTPKAMVGVLDGEVFCMFGITPSKIRKLGVPWLLGSEGIKGASREFLRRNRETLDDLSIGYDSLVNFVWSENTEHIRWLKWLSFTVEETFIHLGSNQEIFYRFHKHLKE